jgi:hypothetical protein
MDGLSLRAGRDNQRGVASSQNALGELSIAERDFGKAIRAFEVALAVWYSAQEKWNIANSHASAGYSQARARETLSAKHNLYEGLEISRRISAWFVVLKALIGWAQIRIYEERYADAAILLGVIDGHSGMTAQLRQIYYDPVAAALDMETYSAEFALGKEMDIGRMIEAILAEAQQYF